MHRFLLTNCTTLQQQYCSKPRIIDLKLIALWLFFTELLSTSHRVCGFDHLFRLYCETFRTIMHHDIFFVEVDH